MTRKSESDLIAESHQAEVVVLAMSQGKDPALGVSVVKTIQRLADALEAATRERDAALARIAELEATVDAQYRQIEARSGETAAERMFKEELLKAKARIAEVAKLHRSETARNGYSWCVGCSTDEYETDWPCGTAVALGLTAEQEGGGS